MTFNEFATYLAELEKTASRIAMTEKVAALVRALDKDEVGMALYFLQGRLAPKYTDTEFNLSRKLLLKALQSVTPDNDTTQLFAELGDTGSVAEYVVEKYTNTDTPGSLFDISSSEVQEPASITQVHASLLSIAHLGGTGSQQGKQDQFLQLILQLDPLSAKYATRIIIGELRLGISDKTILDALSWFVTGDKSLRSDFDRAFGAKADLGVLAELAKMYTDAELLLEQLQNISVTPGVPVAAKLVEREKSVEKVWERMPECFVQPKLDGLRGQIHYDAPRNVVEIFSRNMERLTDHFPEIIESVREIAADSVILDAEIIGYDNENDTYLTYQETMQRRRKYDVASYAEQFPVRAMCFDVLFVDNKDITTEPLEERLHMLRRLVEQPVGALHLLETVQMQYEQELDTYFQQQVGDGLEGIITKQPGTPYEPGSRNFSWIKLKANTQASLVDTIDVVVLGYYAGRGQRSKFGVGALLTGVYDPDTDSYYSVGKVGSGMTDETLATIQKDIASLVRESAPDNVFVEKQLHPDVWLDPKIIIEIDADEITRSPHHSAARGVSAQVPKDNSDRGLSVRFPRLKIWNRDKDVPTTVAELVRMYELRKGSR